MKARFFSSMLAAFMLATASVGGITASAAERASAGEDAAKTTASMRTARQILRRQLPIQRKAPILR